MRIYADSADYLAWTGETTEPPKIQGLLRMASSKVEQAAELAHYETDDKFMPTDEDVAEAFRDATCAQAAHLASNGVDPSTGAAASVKVVASQSMKGAALTFVVDQDAIDRRAQAADTLALEAYNVLKGAGLLNGWVRVS